MDSNDAAFSPSRQATRAPVNLLVRLEMEGPHGRTLEARCNNISIGGMFVLSDVVAESGQQMRFELDVGEAGVVQGLAEVVWCQPASERRPAGLGFKFRYLEQRDRQLIFKLVSRHIKERLASRPATSPPPAPSGPTPTLLTPPDSPSGPPAFAVAPPPVSSAAEVPPAAPPPAPAFSASSTHQTTPSIAPPPSPAPPPPAPPPAPRDQQSQAPAFSVPSSPASGPPTPAPEPRPRAVPAVTLPLPVATPIEAADGPPAAPVGQQSLEGLFGAEPAAGGLDPRRPSSSPSPLGDRPPSMGFKDLGTSAEPEMAYREAAPAAQSGPTILQDDVGDSLFGDPVDEPLSLGPDDTGYADYLGDSHFEHRPQPKKERPVLIISALLLVLAGALAYLFGAGLFEFGQTGPAPGSSAGAASVATEAEGDSREGQAKADATAPTSSADAAARGERATRPDRPQARASEPPRRTGDERRAPAASRPAPPPKRPGARDRSFEDLTFRSEGSAIEILASVSGPALRKVDYEHFRLDGDKPRQVVKIFGVSRTERPALSVGRGGVRQVRTGWHREPPRGSQVHLVIDFDGDRARVTEVRTDGRRLVIRVEP